MPFSLLKKIQPSLMVDDKKPVRQRSSDDLMPTTSGLKRQLSWLHLHSTDHSEASQLAKSTLFSDSFGLEAPSFPSYQSPAVFNTPILSSELGPDKFFSGGNIIQFWDEEPLDEEEWDRRDSIISHASEFSQTSLEDAFEIIDDALGEADIMPKVYARIHMSDDPDIDEFLADIEAELIASPLPTSYEELSPDALLGPPSPPPKCPLPPLPVEHCLFLPYGFPSPPASPTR